MNTTTYGTYSTVSEQHTTYYVEHSLQRHAEVTQLFALCSAILQLITLLHCVTAMPT
jgi:hypothetical protein